MMSVQVEPRVSALERENDELRGLLVLTAQQVVERLRAASRVCRPDAVQRVDHEERAEALLAQVEADRYLRADEIASLVARAGVHAQLAIAGHLGALVAR
jgi:hypothetical protein